MAYAHSPLPWEIDRSSVSGGIINVAAPADHNRTVILSGFAVSQGVPSERALANSEFVFRACNAHYQMLEALKTLDAWWTDSFPAGPDAEDVSYGFGKLSEDTLAIWRQVRAAIAAAEAEGRPAPIRTGTPEVVSAHA